MRCRPPPLSCEGRRGLEKSKVTLAVWLVEVVVVGVLARGEEQLVDEALVEEKNIVALLGVTRYYSLHLPGMGVEGGAHRLLKSREFPAYFCPVIRHRVILNIPDTTSSVAEPVHF